MPFIVHVDDQTMTGRAQLSGLGLAMTLQDAAALADAWGPGSRISLGGEAHTSDILAPAALTLSENEAEAALKAGAKAYFLSFGNQATPPDVDALAPVLDALIARSGIGFMSVCFAAPALGRNVYQGHMFQDGRLIENLHHALSENLSGRVAVIPYDIVTAGAAAIQRRIAACREQGFALALLDAVDVSQCTAIAEALEGQLLTGGPAWLTTVRQKPEPATALAGKLAILSGALDRQTLFQLGAARAAMPFLQLDLRSPLAVESALAWAAAQDQNFILSASAPPDRLHRDSPVASILGEVAAGLAAQGIRRFVITGNDTAAAILTRLGIKTLIASSTYAGLRWLSSEKYNFLLKPAGFGDQSLFLGGFEPQIRLNAAAE